MKKIVLYIDTMNRGGAQRVMVNLAGYLAKEGIETVLVTDVLYDEKRPQYDVPINIRRKSLSDSLSGNPVKKNINRILGLRKIIKEEKPETVLSFLGRPNITMLLAARGLNVRKIVSVRNDPHKEYGSSGLRQKFIGWLFQKADGVDFQTKDAAQYFPELVRKRSAIILNPVDEKFFKAKRESKTRNIITVGRLEKQKNHKLLISAFSKVAEDIPEDNLLICGDGPLKEELELYAENLSLNNRVVFKGNIPNIEEELSRASLFVLSSDWEGLPNALMEAMAVGVPVVSTNCPCGGPRTLIRRNNEGILVSCGDVDAMTSAIQIIMRDKKLQSEMSKHEKKRSEDFFPEKVFNQWKEYLFK